MDTPREFDSSFSLIVAVEKDLGIGFEGKMPWPRLPADMQYFKELTTKTSQEGKVNCVIMGRKTYQSIPPKFFPFAGRYNIIISQNDKLAKENNIPFEVDVAPSVESAIFAAALARKRGAVENIFVIGGAQIYEMCITHPSCKRVYLTAIDASFKCDAFFPRFINYTKIWNLQKPLDEYEEKEHNGIKFKFLVYDRVVTDPIPKALWTCKECGSSYQPFYVYGWYNTDTYKGEVMKWSIYCIECAKKKGKRIVPKHDLH